MREIEIIKKAEEFLNQEEVEFLVSGEKRFEKGREKPIAKSIMIKTYDAKRALQLTTPHPVHQDRDGNLVIYAHVGDVIQLTEEIQWGDDWQDVHRKEEYGYVLEGERVSWEGAGLYGFLPSMEYYKVVDYDLAGASFRDTLATAGKLEAVAEALRNMALQSKRADVPQYVHDIFNQLKEE